MRIALGLLLVACLVPRAAHAGRNFYGWLYGTEVMPERGVELQTWVFDENGKYGPTNKQTWLWWGPVIGVTDQLELALPIEMQWSSSDTNMTSFTWRSYGLEARYRLVSADPSDAPPVVPLVRVAVKRDISLRDAGRVEGDAVMSFDVGSLNALIDLGFIGDISAGTTHTEARPSGGLSLRVSSELRLGGEIYAELSLDTKGESWAIAGPNLSWTHGRFWFSGTAGIGIYHMKLAPRAMWGIAF